MQLFQFEKLDSCPLNYDLLIFSNVNNITFRWFDILIQCSYPDCSTIQARSRKMDGALRWIYCFKKHLINFSSDERNLLVMFVLVRLNAFWIRWRILNELFSLPLKKLKAWTEPAAAAAFLIEWNVQRASRSRCHDWTENTWK